MKEDYLSLPLDRFTYDTQDNLSWRGKMYLNDYHIRNLFPSEKKCLLTLFLSCKRYGIDYLYLSSFLKKIDIEPRHKRFAKTEIVDIEYSSDEEEIET